MLNTEWQMCLAFSGFAVALLLQMMRRRQLKLIGLLKSYIERRTEWDRRKARATALAAAELAKKAPEPKS
jgi:hypothetical protein